MADFKPCQGKDRCRYDHQQCLVCGRSLEAINTLRVLLDQLAILALEQNYDNTVDYCTYISAKLQKIINHRQLEQEQTC